MRRLIAPACVKKVHWGSLCFAETLKRVSKGDQTLLLEPCWKSNMHFVLGALLLLSLLFNFYLSRKIHESGQFTSCAIAVNLRFVVLLSEREGNTMLLISE